MSSPPRAPLTLPAPSRAAERAVVGSMHERTAPMAELSDSFVAAPGGTGTFEEFAEIAEIATWSTLRPRAARSKAWGRQRAELLMSCAHNDKCVCTLRGDGSRTMTSSARVERSVPRVPALGASPGERAAFVLGGGGNLGAIQVGMVYALAERGILPSLIVGTSVGAINGAFLASRADLDGIAEIAEIARFWQSLRRADILRVDAATVLRGLPRRDGHLFDSSGLRSALQSFVGFERIEEAPIPLAVVATESGSRRPVVLDSGDVVMALLASNAIPRLLPPVVHAGTVLVDGSVAADMPVRQAVALGATQLFVLPTARHQLHVLGVDSVGSAAHPQMHVIPAPQVRAPRADLRHTGQLLEIGYEHARAFLAAGTSSGTSLAGRSRRAPRGPGPSARARPVSPPRTRRDRPRSARSGC